MEVCFPRRPHQGQSLSDVRSESKIMADSVEIQFVDESEYQNEGKWYFCIENSQSELRADVSGNIFPFPSKTKNNFRGIDISQSTPLMSLSVPLFSLVCTQ